MDLKRNAMSINIGPAMRYIAVFNEISIAISYSQSLSQMSQLKFTKLKTNLVSIFHISSWDIGTGETVYLFKSSVCLSKQIHTI